MAYLDDTMCSTESDYSIYSSSEYSINSSMYSDDEIEVYATYKTSRPHGKSNMAQSGYEDDMEFSKNSKGNSFSSSTSSSCELSCSARKPSTSTLHHHIHPEDGCKDCFFAAAINQDAGFLTTLDNASARTQAPQTVLDNQMIAVKPHVMQWISEMMSVPTADFAQHEQEIEWPSTPKKSLRKKLMKMLSKNKKTSIQVKKPSFSKVLKSVKRCFATEVRSADSILREATHTAQ